MDNGVHEENSSSQNDNFYITRIEARGTSGEVFMVSLSGGSSFFILSSDTIFEERDIHESSSLSFEDREALEKSARFCEAKQKAYSLLSSSEQSSFRLKQKLMHRGFSESISSQTVQSLMSEGLIDDERYARMWASSRLRKKAEGPSKLMASLLSRGIARETAERVIASLMEEINPEELLMRAIESMHRKTGMTEEKMIRGLISRGFPYQMVRNHLEKKPED